MQSYLHDTAGPMATARPEDQDGPNCLSEANTRLAQTMPTSPAEAPSALAANAIKRCAPLPEDLRKDREARMHSDGTVSGSVEAGGIYRELVTRTTGSDTEPPNDALQRPTERMTASNAKRAAKARLCLISGGEGVRQGSR